MIGLTGVKVNAADGFQEGSGADELEEFANGALL